MYQAFLPSNLSSMVWSFPLALISLELLVDKHAKDSALARELVSAHLLVMMVIHAQMILALLESMLMDAFIPLMLAVMETTVLRIFATQLLDVISLPSFALPQMHATILPAILL